MKGNEICNRECCSCGACFNICPKSAISMEENVRGFLVPIVNQKLCIDCGLCAKVCNYIPERSTIKKASIIKIKDRTQHLISQSGGAFTALSNAIFSMNGVVFGVKMDDKFEAMYAFAKNEKERDYMHGSKYMRARVETIYQDVEQALRTGKVLFSGTPCHVAGLKKYLSVKNVNTSNLYTVDLICHGTPSVKIWRAMLKEIEERDGPITYAITRDKVQYGWGSSSSSTFYAKHKISTDVFCRIFFTDLCLGDSCYTCEYASKARVGDITIGDAWGVKTYNPEFFDSRGVSLLLVNTEKGEELQSIFKSDVESTDVNIESYAQKNLSEPSLPHRSIGEFWDDFEKKPFAFIVQKYGKNNVLLNYRYVIKKVVNKLWRKK